MNSESSSGVLAPASRLTVVYQAYGRLDIVQQALFSIVSLCRFFPNGIPFEIQIFSDQSALLRSFFGDTPNIRVVAIQSEQIQKWRGAIDFVHRVKLEILKTATHGSPNDLVYLDGDTIFKASPVDLFKTINDRVSLMHLRESTLGEPGDPLTKKIGKFVKGKSFLVGGKPIEIPPSTAMWNAGVIGVSKKNTLLFDSMIELTDRLYGQYQKHVMEQLAVSFFLQSVGEVCPSDSVVLHYWPQKEDYDRAIQEFLNSNSTLSACLTNIEQFKWPAENLPQKKKKSSRLFSFFGRS